MEMLLLTTVIIPWVVNGDTLPGTKLTEFLKDHAVKYATTSYSGCKINEFKCGNNKCIPAIRRCDGFRDCEDGSDEYRCSNRCLSGRSCHSMYQCYEASNHCDGKIDCVDFSDEIDCGFCEVNLTRCGVNSTQCYNPLTQRCDRIFHCLNGEDEKDCFGVCPGKIMCDSRSSCYSVKQRCNGVAQCEDASDEKNCVPELCNYEHGGFLCDNGRCIQQIWTCDRTDDCGDGSDERSCLRNSVLTAAVMGSLICALLLVIAISCTCRLHALRMLENRLLSRETPLSRLSRDFFFREPPPSYAVAVEGQRHSNLCVENLHYAAPVYRSRRRSRRSRHVRGPVMPPIPVSRNCVVMGPDGTLSVRPPVPEADIHIGSSTSLSVSGNCRVQSIIQRPNDKNENVPVDSVQKESDQSKETENIKDPNVELENISSVTRHSSDSESISLEPTNSNFDDAASTSMEPSTDHYYCDSDSELLVA